ncbi:MAG: sulfurtransferase [Gammaproteobacteria bacterium]|nr:sulfurtransferase [Gammaproteobacteria bacterium]
MRHFSAAELQDYLQKSQPLLLDVREPWEFNTCRIKGAQLLPMRQVPVEINSLERNRETVVICHHGIRSLQVARFLEHAGFDNVINLTGGVAAWARDVDLSMPTY